MFKSYQQFWVIYLEYAAGTRQFYSNSQVLQKTKKKPQPSGELYSQPQKNVKIEKMEGGK